jgi:hypothetical protein
MGITYPPSEDPDKGDVEEGDPIGDPFTAVKPREGIEVEAVVLPTLFGLPEEEEEEESIPVPKAAAAKPAWVKASTHSFISPIVAAAKLNFLLII